MTRPQRRVPNSRIPVCALIASGLFVLCLAGCGGGGGGGTAAPLSGLSVLAQVTTYGGASYPGKPSPTPAPLPQAVISVQPAGGGQEINRFTTDANGQSRVSLPPGTYLLVPVLSQQDQASGLSAADQPAAVSAGGYASAVVSYTRNAP